MAKKEEKTAADSTEEKIKAAASKLFTQKGYAAVRTRDIATEAGINLALLNYYFRSKEKLFEIIMSENMYAFKKGLAELFSDEKLGVFEKIEKLVDFYITTFLANPDLPLFIANEINKGHQDVFSDAGGNEIQKSREVFIRQLDELAAAGKIQPMHPLHFLSNLMGLILMPFLARPMMKRRLSLDEQQFEALVLERKKLVPVWLKAILINKEATSN